MTAPPEPPALPALAGLRVLVVEDDYYLATDEQRLLGDAGAEVVGPTGDAGEACRLAEAGGVDLALVDINLGLGPSFAVARALEAAAIPFLFTTGYDAGAIPDAFRAVPRVEKPLNERALIAALQKLRT